MKESGGETEKQRESQRGAGRERQRDRITDSGTDRHTDQRCVRSEGLRSQLVVLHTPQHNRSEPACPLWNHRQVVMATPPFLFLDQSENRSRKTPHQ